MYSPPVWRQIFPSSEKKSSSVNNSLEKPFACAGRAFDLTGIDNQFQLFNDHFPKFASSVSHQKGTRYAWIEHFSAYGSGLTIEQMKWITDFSFVRGMNLVSACERYLSTKDFYMAGLRPMFFPGNPLWKYLDVYHIYTARISYLLSLGKPAIENAVYYPIRDVWAGSLESLISLGRRFEGLSRTLFENRRDFDFIDDDLLESDETVISGKHLKAGAMEYSCLYISDCRWISEKSAEKLTLFSKAGGKVVLVESEQFPSAYQGFIKSDMYDVTKYCAPIMETEPADVPIRVCKRVLANGSLYFIVNEGMDEVKCNLIFKEKQRITRLDAETGKFYGVPQAIYSEGQWICPIVFLFGGSYIFFFSNDQIPIVNEQTLTDAVQNTEAVITLDSGWEYTIKKSYHLGDYDFEILDIYEHGYNPIDLNDWSIKAGEDFSGDIEYRKIFTCGYTAAKKIKVLDLGSVKYACEVCLNGNNLGKRAWLPFAFNISGMLRHGENDLRVVVTNTLANQYIHTDLSKRWPEKLIGLYHKIEMAFEEDSKPSGLYGPVRLI